MLEVSLNKHFLVVKETLTRMGVRGGDNKLIQSCHIYHKNKKYYIAHFKELFEEDGKETTITDTDLSRRDAIALTLEKWGHINILSDLTNQEVEYPKFSIIKHKDKKNHKLVFKYTIKNHK